MMICIGLPWSHYALTHTRVRRTWEMRVMHLCSRPKDANLVDGLNVGGQRSPACVVSWRRLNARPSFVVAWPTHTQQQRMYSVQ